MARACDREEEELWKEFRKYMKSRKNKKEFEYDDDYKYEEPKFIHKNRAGDIYITIVNE